MEYVDTGTAHRCRGCGASVHRDTDYFKNNPDAEPKNDYDATWGIIVCDRTGEDINICMVNIP